MKTTAVALILCIATICNAQEPPIIVIPTNPSPAVTLASKEVRRYVYIRTGKLPVIVSDNQKIPRARSVIAIAPNASRLLANLPVEKRLRDSLHAMPLEGFCLRTLPTATGSILLVCGATDISTLYGAYALAETMGIRFSAHGDDIPDGRITWSPPVLAEWHTPLFATRGLQPFHDFPEGPDWWSVDDYKALFAQMVKMRMNFFGLHTYPEGGVGPEPTVWIGYPEDILPGTGVARAYPARYFTTAGDPAWGYNPQLTSTYLFGCGQYFDAEAYGSMFMAGYAPHDPIGTNMPYKPDVLRHPDPTRLPAEGWNGLFDRTARLFANAFTFGRGLGVKMCIGTETPLTVPAAVRQRALALGKDTTDRILRRDLYEGMFTRIMQTIPLDYYWFWTPEDWTWSGTNDAHIAQTRADPGRGHARRGEIERAVLLRHMRMGARAGTGPRDVRHVPAEVVGDELHQPQRGLRSRGPGFCEDHRPSALGDPLARGRSRIDHSATLGRTHARRRCRCARVRMHRTHRHPLAHPRPQSEHRLARGRGVVTEGLEPGCRRARLSRKSRAAQQGPCARHAGGRFLS
ncbi:MAG: hypothetical protein IPI01_20405 [Ignavibacteriae bacterium]|nr:hypothetical protein [Ignavibacteriota bacterium]